ncbi:MAG: DUF2333 family protein [Rhodospirillaceae bacterium]|jgi:hypothetical protein|nr:DUF2333 family protein [Rhodospirillaceae bacterium]MBT4042398.1 DUF2333 family protein [Rhodospirillaceae bacterium]MBT4688269.1 DUF2333 family protein [Rhodospirillaceae bacterium]MBT5079262.1 DUF2333 family protein [Rhodospirillaceae bacterium]MBT5522454.1 DUF2333 family protein [Rhodospirillaceae bacterium]
MVADRLMGQARRLLPDFSGTGKRTAGGIGIAILVAVLLYYPVGMVITNSIDDDVDYKIADAALPEGGSRAVAMAASLITREVDENRWVANDPFFLPPSALDNMPNYQQGIISALARFAFELTDQIGRTRGTSQTDKDLQEAAGQLQYAGDVWVFDLSTSLAPTTTSEARYRKAARSLRNYNQRLSAGNAIFEKRADNLMATLDRFALDMGASSATLDRHIAEHAGDFIDLRSDDVFYGIKGQSYAYYLIIRDLGLDYAHVLSERELTNAWSNMLESLRHTAELSPMVVVNGTPDAQAMPSHLAAQGFYLLRARTKLREITNILLK